MSNAITIKDLTDFKDAIVSELRGDITDLRKEFQSDIADLRTELKTDIANLRVEFKTDLADLRTGLREEMLAGFAGVAEAIDSVLQQLDDYHQYQKHQSKLLSKLDYRVVMVETRLSRRQQAGGFGPA